MRRLIPIIVLAPALAAACASEVPPSTVTGSVTDRVTGAPVSGALVYAPGRLAVARTAADGTYALATESDAVMVAAPGYLSMRRAVDLSAPAGGADLALFPAAIDDIAAARLIHTRLTDDDLTSDTGDLRPRARTLLAALEARAGSVTTLRDVTGAVFAHAAPTSIRVWRRGLDGSTASCSGRVDVIPFEQYVKGVLPHEWIPSWDPKSLEMGAVAIRTYAWWWVEAGGKYDCADLDDTTASQVYEDETLAKTDDAVDATAGAAIMKDGSVVFAQYSAENGDPTLDGIDDPHCAGRALFGHGHGTCQWGTQRWAINEGKDYLFMAPHYYPGSTVVLPGPQFDAAFAAESYPLTMTSGDEAVVWLEYTNHGAVTWDLDDTRIGTTEPRDRPSAFYKEGNWLSPSRPTAADHSSYGPGATGRFTFAIKAPEVEAPTTFVEHFALVQEGVTWFGPEDTFVTWTITVNPRNGTTLPDAGGNDPGATPGTGDGGAPNALGCAIAPTGRGGGAGSNNPWGLTRGTAMLLLAAAVYRRGRQFALLGVAALALVVGACTGTGTGAGSGAGTGAGTEGSGTGTARVAVGGDSALGAVFAEAARETGVPAELLATVAFVETRLRMNLTRHPGDGDDASPPQYGVMALSVGGLRDVDAAAARIGVDVEIVKTDVAANVRAAGAALAAELATQGIAASDMARMTYAEWASAIRAYGGQSLVDEVMWRLERGWRGLDDTRQHWVVVSARAVGGEGGGISVQSHAAGYGPAIWNPAYSGNYQASSRGAADINYVVIHTTQGSYGGTINWFKNPDANVSSHYVVRSSDGQITQMVDDSDVAWHDACFNSQSIGIEHEGFVDDPDTWYTEAMYMHSAELTAWLCDQYGIPKDHAHIMGHAETPDCSDHTDPGGGWDWGHYLALVSTGGMPTFDANPGDMSAPTVMTSGDEGVVWFEFTNGGNSTWGIDETRLGTQDPEDRASAFFVDGNWLAPNRATGADHSNYGPGSTGRFTFAIKAPEVTEETTFTEAFQLVQEGVTWFGPKVSMTITVRPRVAPEPPATPLDPTPPTSDGDGHAGGGTGGCAVAPLGRGAAGTNGAGGAADGAIVFGCAMLVVGASLLLRRRSRR